MKFNKRTNTVVLWLISIGLLVGMVISFTPTLGLGGGGSTSQPVALKVNGEPVYETTISQARQNPLFHRVTEGEVGADLQLLLVDSVIRQELMQQASARSRVSNSEVNRAVNEFREEQGLAGSRNDNAYLNVIGASGFDDQSFRSNMKAQLRQQKWDQSLTGDATVTDEEVATFYEAFKSAYRNEERISARLLSVSDPELATELRNRLLGGEDFAELATEHSLDRADRGGALGAPSGSTEPLPVGQAALPPAVASAAFGLRAPGLTQVVSADGLYYLVSVEEFLPATVRPFDEVAEEVREDALQAKKSGIINTELERLMQESTITIPADSELTYTNTVVATVGDSEIQAADLAYATYSNAQAQQLLDPSSAFLIEQLIKPGILEDLIDQKLAFLGSGALAGAFIGTELQVAQEALDFVARDVSVSEDDITAHYEENGESFTVEASAEVFSYEFPDFEEAEAFRNAVLAGTLPLEAAEAAGIEPEDLGTVRPGTQEAVIDLALFSTDAFEELPDSQREVSDVLFIASTELPEGEDEAAADAESATETADADETAVETSAEESGAEAAAGEQDEAELGEPSRHLVLIASRTPERVRTLAEVHDQVHETLLQQVRSEVQQDWLDELRAETPVDNLYAAARAEGEFDFTVPVEENGSADEETDAADDATDDATDAAEPDQAD